MSQKSCFLYRPDELSVTQSFPVSSAIGNQRSQRTFSLAELQGEEHFCWEFSEQKSQRLESLGLFCSAGNTQGQWSEEQCWKKVSTEQNLPSLSHHHIPKVSQHSEVLKLPRCTHKGFHDSRSLTLPSSVFATSGPRLGNGKIQNLVVSNGWVAANTHQMSAGEPE